MDITTPEIVQAQSADIQLLIWLFGIVIGGLGLAIIALWKANKEQSEYIREQDKANLTILNEVLNLTKVSGLDVSKLTELLLSDIKPNVKEILSTIHGIITRMDNLKSNSHK